MLRHTRLKEKLIKRIIDIDNGEILNQIARLVHFEERFDEIYIMSPAEIEAVNEGLEQFKNGQWISNEEANKHVDEFLKKHE
jgi:hypothetical protein